MARAATGVRGRRQRGRDGEAPHAASTAGAGKSVPKVSLSRLRLRCAPVMVTASASADGVSVKRSTIDFQAVRR